MQSKVATLMIAKLTWKTKFVRCVALLDISRVLIASQKEIMGGIVAIMKTYPGYSWHFNS